MTLLRKNVYTEITANKLCVGCGLCAALCPGQNLKIEFNDYGEYAAAQTSAECPDTCSACLKVCPFSSQAENEDVLGQKLFAGVPGIKYTAQTGYYLDSFVGYSTVNGHRENGASGGLATFTLESLLEQKLVDEVLCVCPVKEPAKLFKFVRCSSAEKVRACSRSCYYPVEASEVIGHILQNEGRYAVIGLPCLCKAIRSAMQLNPNLRHRIKFVLGLVCGQAKSKFFVESICAMAGGEPHFLREVACRVKEPNRPSSDFGMKMVWADKENPVHEAVIFWTDGINRMWCDHYFTPNACNFCDDVFAELADASFMDAWLPGYSKDPKGHNIVIVRNSVLADIFARAADSGAIKKTNLNIKQVIRSQQGAVDLKRKCLLERCRLARIKGQAIPQKRFWLCKPGLSPLEKLIVKLTWQISQESPQKWLESDKNLQRFEKEFAPLASKLRKLRAIDRYIQLPFAGFARIRGLLRC